MIDAENYNIWNDNPNGILSTLEYFDNIYKVINWT